MYEVGKSELPRMHISYRGVAPRPVQTGHAEKKNPQSPGRDLRTPRNTIEPTALWDRRG